jgi:cellobiose phosphorylase
MNYQAFRECALMLERSGDSAKANELKTISDRIRQDFNRYLVRDGIVAGYGLVEADGEISIMLHPTDRLTGISYSLLPMNRGIISGIFTREQALHHAEIIEKHLKGPDGARLMDRPLRYRGGIQEIFQRAESSTYFGREIGLMYIHEHIRYAEGLAKTGRPEAFVKALRQAIPVGYRDVVPCGAPRQSNCYYSSSDVTFASRYQADTDYEDVIGGKLPLKGGWRVYSSGPGIFIGIVVTRLLGLRLESGSVILDPVMPKNFDGFRAGIEILDHPVVLKYSVGNTGYSPLKILINNKEIEFNYEENPYRQGGAVMDREEFLGLLNPSDNLVEIFL